MAEAPSNGLNPHRGGEDLPKLGDKDLGEALQNSRKASWQKFGRKIRFYTPSFIPYKTQFYASPRLSFPSISITGSFCALQCEHCKGRLLEGMLPVRTPNELVSLCKKLKEGGAVGCLISGGCTQKGEVPLGTFLEGISEVRRKLNFLVATHVGIIRDEEFARRLGEAGVNSVLIDIIGSNETIRKVYHLELTVEDYERSLRLLHEAGVRLMPHVLVGLHYGKLKGEFEALRMISKYQPQAVIIIALTPLRGTPMEKVTPPTPEDVARVLVYARSVLPATPLVLGCVRPLGEHRVKTDKLAVLAGVNAIAFPVGEALQVAKKMDLETSFSPVCCSQIYEDLMTGFFEAGQL